MGCGVCLFVEAKVNEYCNERVGGVADSPDAVSAVTDAAFAKYVAGAAFTVSRLRLRLRLRKAEALLESRIVVKWPLRQTRSGPMMTPLQPYSKPWAV